VTDEEIAAIEARAAAATAARVNLRGWVDREAGDLAASAADVPALLAEVRRLRLEIREADALVERYVAVVRSLEARAAADGGGTYRG
jgi:hypothetical protein